MAAGGGGGGGGAGRLAVVGGGGGATATALTLGRRGPDSRDGLTWLATAAASAAWASLAASLESGAVSVVSPPTASISSTETVVTGPLSASVPLFHSESIAPVETTAGGVAADAAIQALRLLSTKKTLMIGSPTPLT